MGNTKSGKKTFRGSMMNFPGLSANATDTLVKVAFTLIFIALL